MAVAFATGFAELPLVAIRQLPVPCAKSEIVLCRRLGAISAAPLGGELALGRDQGRAPTDGPLQEPSHP